MRSKPVNTVYKEIQGSSRASGRDDLPDSAGIYTSYVAQKQNVDVGEVNKNGEKRAKAHP